MYFILVSIRKYQLHQNHFSNSVFSSPLLPGHISVFSKQRPSGRMMRPLAGSEALQPRSRKPSLTGPSPLSDTCSTSPVTFFLRRASHDNDTSSSSEVMRGQGASSVQSLADSLNGLAESTSTVVTKNDADEAGQSSPRRSALKSKGHVLSQRSPSDKDQTQSSQQEPLTPLLIPSDTSSLPSSPKSTSSRSLRPSEADSVAGDAGSQAILSSGDEGPEPEASVQPAEAAPQLIMPSIKMPSRRPFSERGKQIGNLKILIAGGRGLYKVPTSSRCVADVRRGWQNIAYKIYRSIMRRHSPR
jgi:hypothetical protein